MCVKVSQTQTVSNVLGTTEFSPQVAEPPGDTVVTVKTYTSSDFTSNWHAKARKMASETHMPSSAGECLLSTPLERYHGGGWVGEKIPTKPLPSLTVAAEDQLINHVSCGHVKQ